ncbi:MAG: hypothetical protein ACT4OU_13270 [Hyphomicrobium sp.]
MLERTAPGEAKTMKMTKHSTTPSPQTDVAPDAATWAPSLASIVAFVETSGANVIGLVSDREGAGVTLISHELAAAYRRFGRRAIALDASELARKSGIDVSPTDRSPAGPRQRGVVEAADEPTDLTGLSAMFDEAFRAECATHDVVFVDLPPMANLKGFPNPVFMAAGRHCQMSLMVCMTGEMSQSDMSRCLDTCKASGVNIGGILLNDQKLAWSRMLKSD